MDLSYNKHKSEVNEIFVVIYILHLIRFYFFIPYVNLNNILNIIDTFYAVFFVICFIKYKIRKPITKLELATVFLYLIFCFSIFNGIRGGQEIARVLKYTSMVFLQFGFYFYIRLYNIRVNFLLRFLNTLLIGYALISVLCYLQYPHLLFGGNDVQSLARMKTSLTERGLIRFTLPCKMLIPLFIFIEVQNLGLKAYNKAKILFLFILLFLIGNRFPLVVSLLVIIYMIILSDHIKFMMKVKAGLIIIGLIFLFSIIPITRNIMLAQIQTTLNEKDAGDENNIRVLSATYFFTEFNHDKLTPIIIGNGIPSNGNDKYSKRIKSLNEEQIFWEGDVGYCEIYIYFGIVGLFALFFWCYGIYNIKIEIKYKYIKYYILFLMISMLCGGYWFENIYIINIITYILVKSNENLKYKKLCVK